jgi:hypothetical protein
MKPTGVELVEVPASRKPTGVEIVEVPVSRKPTRVEEQEKQELQRCSPRYSMNIHSPDLISGSSMMSSLQAVELPFRRRPSLASHRKAADVCSGTLVTRSGNLVTRSGIFWPLCATECKRHSRTTRHPLRDFLAAQRFSTSSRPQNARSDQTLLATRLGIFTRSGIFWPLQGFTLAQRHTMQEALAHNSPPLRAFSGRSKI